MESDNKTSCRNGFNQMFVESVEETIASLLGRTVSHAFTTHLQAYIGLALEEIPNRPDLLFKALQGSFGAGAGDRVGKYFVRKLYLKAGLQFAEHDGGTLVEYVEALKRKFAESSEGSN